MIIIIATVSVASESWVFIEQLICRDSVCIHEDLDT